MGWSGLAIGFIGSFWHLPLFYYFPSGVAGLPLGYYIPLVTALGVVGGETLSGGRCLLTIFVVLLVILASAIFLQIRSVKKVHSSNS